MSDHEDNDWSLIPSDVAVVTNAIFIDHGCPALSPAEFTALRAFIGMLLERREK